MAKDVVKKEQAGLPAEFAGLEDYAGQGLDDLDNSDRSVPFIKVLEKNSPEIETVTGAKPGMFINTATQQLYDTIRFVPTSAMLNGDFTAVTSPACNNGRQLTLSAPFANNRIPTNLINPTAKIARSFLLFF